MEYGFACRVCRAARGYSQTELARRARVSYSMISLLESKNREPSLDLVQNLTSALGIKPYLFMALADREHLDKVSDEVAVAILMWLIES